MTKLTQFKAVHCSGCLIHDPSLITALALLFEKVYLPRNLELISAFSNKYRFAQPDDTDYEEIISIIPEKSDADDPFSGLTPSQRSTAFRYLKYIHNMISGCLKLFPIVFETEMFPSSEPLEVELIKKGLPGKKNLYRVNRRSLEMVSEDNETIPRLLNSGYIPLVTNVHLGEAYSQQLDDMSTKQLAALLGMASVSLILPRTRAAHPDVILEARERLSNHLPPFWSSMLKLTEELKRRIADRRTFDKVLKDTQDLVDATVLPALVDLQSKMEKERKQFFYRILAPIQKGLRLLVGNPPITQQQLLTNALILGSDVAMSAAGHMQTIEALKNEAGLTFLLQLGEMWSRD